jgi:hypothetical protein
MKCSASLAFRRNKNAGVRRRVGDWVMVGPSGLEPLTSTVSR